MLKLKGCLKGSPKKVNIFLVIGVSFCTDQMRNLLDSPLFKNQPLIMKSKIIKEENTSTIMSFSTELYQNFIIIFTVSNIAKIES